MAGIGHEAFDASNCIRILYLEPGWGDDPISAELVILRLAPLQPKLDWEAVSYRWDTSGQQKPIFLNGSTVLVAQNLQKMLGDLRLENEQRRLWIDAICIDQMNENEKSAQVPMMRLIYERARRVIIWLDCSDRENEAIAVYKAAEFIAHREGQELITSSENSLRPLRTVFRQHVADIEWNTPFHKVLKLHWFQRIWVVQEAVLAKHLIVNLSRLKLEWDVFASAALKYMSMQPAWYTTISDDWFEYHQKCRSLQYDNSVMSGKSFK